MNTVKRYSDPNNPWWRYAVEQSVHEADGHGYATIIPFATAQGAANYIETRFPGVPFRWDTREPEAIAEADRRDLDRWEQARSDAREDARLEREEE